MKKYYRTNVTIDLTAANNIFKWVDTLNPAGITHFGLIGNENTIEELIRADDLVTVDDITVEVIEKDGVLYLSDGETELDSVTIQELWIKCGQVITCVAIRDNDKDCLVLTNRS